MNHAVFMTCIRGPLKQRQNDFHPFIINRITSRPRTLDVAGYFQFNLNLANRRLRNDENFHVVIASEL